MVTLGLVESNGSLSPVYDSHHLQADCQERISSGTLRSAIECGLSLPFSLRYFETRPMGRSEDTEFVGNNLQQHFGQFCARQLGVGRPSRAAFAGAQFYRFRSHKFVDRGLQAFESVAGDVVDQLTDYPAVARRFIQHHVIAGRPRDTLTRRRQHFAISSSSSSCSFNRKLSNATHKKIRIKKEKYRALIGCSHCTV